MSDDNQFKKGDDGLGSGSSVADILLGGMRSLSTKMDTLMMNDAAQKQAFEDLQKDYLTTKGKVDNHEALKHRMGGIIAASWFVLTCIGIVFWKVVDYLMGVKST